MRLVGLGCLADLRFSFASLGALCIATACAGPQPVSSVRIFNVDATTVMQALAVDKGILITQRTSVRTARELISPDGQSLSRTFTDRRVLRTHVDGDRLTAIEEISPGISVVVQGRLGEPAPGIVSTEANWTEIVKAPSGDILAVESLFLSQNVAPSACRIKNLTRNRVEFEDNFSYHYPVTGRDLLLVSPIDRKIRRLAGGFATEIGSVNSIEGMPLVGHDGRWTAWFGPEGTGSALYVCEPGARPIVLIPSTSEHPMTWLGNGLLVAWQDELSHRWTLKHYSIPDGLIQRTFPIPENVDARTITGSPTGDYIGLSAAQGSVLIRVSDNFVQVFDGVPLSSWLWSTDGASLYLLAQNGLRVVSLR